MKRIALLLLAGVLSAYDFTLSGEALYLRPSYGMPDMVIESPNLPADIPIAGQLVGANRPAYAWGYRIEAEAQKGTSSLAARWMSWIHTNTTTIPARNFSDKLWIYHEPPGNIANEFFGPSTARQHDKYLVLNLDIEAKRWSLNGYVRLFGGLRYARFRVDTRFLAQGVYGNLFPAYILLEWESNMQGYGPRAGLEGRSPSYRGFHFKGEVSGTLLVGTSKGNQLLESISAVPPARSPFAIKNVASPSTSMIFMIGDLSCALHWGALRWGPTLIDAEVGYMIRYYTPGTQRTIFYNANNRAGSNVNLMAFAIDGFNFRLGIKY